MIELAYGIATVAVCSFAMVPRETRVPGAAIFAVWAFCLISRKLELPTDVFYTGADVFGMVTLAFVMRRWFVKALVTLLAVQVVLHWTLEGIMYGWALNSLYVVQLLLLLGVTLWEAGIRRYWAKVVQVFRPHLREGL